MTAIFLWLIRDRWPPNEAAAAYGCSFDVMMVPEAANMPPTP
jgi:hypothetical protein